MIWILATVGCIGIIGMAVEHQGNHDALYTMVGHIAIFGTCLLNYRQARANGAKLDAAKVAIAEKESRE